MKMTKLEKIVQRLAENAEGANYHGLVREYPRIAAVLTKYVSEGIAAKIMTEIGDLYD